jgi:shikimate kinase
MIRVLIGHRGTGKSALLKRWRTYDSNAQVFDLDLEIEKQQQMTVSEIFKNFGEKKFREIEKNVYLNLSQIENAVIACGAGIDVSLFSEQVRVYWIRRDSDKDGRIFTDRPRLDVGVSAIQEFKQRFEFREPLYAKSAHFIYTLPEGLQHSDEQEKQILLAEPVLNGALTILKNEIKSHRSYQNVAYEWRDDLLSVDEFLSLEKYLNKQEVFFSVRTQQDVPEFVMSSRMKIDWDINRPLPQNLKVHYISTHQDQLALALDQLKPYEDSTYHLKLCPLISDWKDLETGFKWQQKDPQKRNFLPRSAQGSWGWFRLMMKSKQKLNFFREGAGSSADQPTVWEWLSKPGSGSPKFAAVLGSPVPHSHSPVFHKTFFKHIPFYKVEVDQTNWSDSMVLLERWGLSFAAVTSPLKNQAGEFVQKSALNTLVKDFKNLSWIGTNTDLVGLEKIFAPIQRNHVVVWGGGGLLETFQTLLPNAILYSARTGTPRQGQKDISSVDVLIWAAGDADISKIPPDWKPRLVIDMSYKENSPARDYALSKSIQYQSGHELFELQAKAQQAFWKNYV